ncbi:MAG: hypothetical protein ACKO40_16105 [Planctomycetaceae bacterium]
MIAASIRLLAIVGLSAGASVSTAASIDFDRDIRPLFAAHVEIVLPAPSCPETGTEHTPAEPRRMTVADAVDGPFDPRDTLRADPAGCGGFPVLTGPRWCVFVLADPTAVPRDGRGADLDHPVGGVKLHHAGLPAAAFRTGCLGRPPLAGAGV